MKKRTAQKSFLVKVLDNDGTTIARRYFSGEYPKEVLQKHALDLAHLSNKTFSLRAEVITIVPNRDEAYMKSKKYTLLFHRALSGIWSS